MYMIKKTKVVFIKDGEILEVIAKDNQEAKVIILIENNKLCIKTQD